MLYAVTDIETTGGYAAAARITEVAVHLYDGEKVVDHFTSLVNPGVKIPYYITGLTGITDQMVAKAPRFEDIAPKLHSLFAGNVFVAHSVNFDYSFLKKQLNECGFQLDSKKLCTVRMGRKVFPGLPSYSLGNICGYLGITIKDRHRADGDAAATVQLLEKILNHDNQNAIPFALKRNSKDYILPPNVPRQQFDCLPQQPGVYYFHDKKGKIVYVGKAINIRKRVISHFSNNSPARQKQEFMREVHSISFEACGNELVAMLVESHEIKRLWPRFNNAQKRFEPQFGIIDYHDQKGLHRLAVERATKAKAVHLQSFSTHSRAHSFLWAVVTEHGLCPRLAGLATELCTNTACACHTGSQRKINNYNKQMQQAIEAIKNRQQSFVIVEQGRTEAEAACVVVQQGHLTGVGYCPTPPEGTLVNPQQFSNTFRPLKENFNITQIIESYRAKYPERVLPYPVI